MDKRVSQTSLVPSVFSSLARYMYFFMRCTDLHIKSLRIFSDHSTPKLFISLKYYERFLILSDFIAFTQIKEKVKGYIFVPLITQILKILCTVAIALPNFQNHYFKKGFRIIMTIMAKISEIYLQLFGIVLSVVLWKKTKQDEMEF